MPPKDVGDGGALNSQQGVVGQGDQKTSSVEVEEGETEGKEQVRSTPIPTITNPSLSVSNSLLDDTFDQIEAIMESKDFSKEQMERMATGLIDAAKLLARAIKPEHEKRKED